MRDVKARVKAALATTRHPPDDDIVEELAAHASTAYEAARADGCDAVDADGRVDALIAIWCSDAGRLRRRPKRDPIVVPPAGHSSWSGIGHDVTYGLRLLRRHPGFTAVAILTIALGIGATTLLFGVVYGVLMKPLPWPESDRLVRLSETRQGSPGRVRSTITNATFNAWTEHSTTIESIGGWQSINTSATLATSGESIMIPRVIVTPSIFTVLKARPLAGRLFVDDDARSGGSAKATDVVILSYGLWQERFGGRDDAVGKTIQLDGRPFAVVGIMPREFVFPDRAARAWTPFAVFSVMGEQGSRRVSIFGALARLRPGASAAQAAAEGTARARSAPDLGLAATAMFGGNGPAEITATAALDAMTADVKQPLMVLFTAVVLLLVTATANVASLQLARATTRRREIAVRSAIGAGAGRIARQLLIESVMLGALGGAGGILLAAAMYRVLPALLPADFPRSAEIGMNGWVLMCAVALAVIAGVAFGLWPALHAGRMSLSESLTRDGAAPIGGGSRTTVARARTLIMAGQVAVSCVLLVGAALLTRSFVALLHADRGYDPRQLLTARLPLPSGFSMARRTQLLDTVVGRLRAMPGVTEVAFGNALPLLTSGGYRGMKMRPPIDPSREVDVNTIERVVSPGYFAALGLRIAAGRTFTDADTMTSPEVIVVNRSFAAKYLGAAPVGTTVPNLGMCRGDNDRWEVVGVVDDMRQGAVGDPAQPEVFLPYRQVGCPVAVAAPIIVVRTAGDPVPYAAVLRGLLRDEAPALALDSVMTMEDRLMTTLARPRLYAVLLGTFAGFAALIASVGLFGVLSYSVAQRAREIGVRMALGAQSVDIVGLVVRQLAVMAIGGLAAGLAVAFVAATSLSTFLYGVQPHDAFSFVVVPTALAGVIAVACIVPARRAARIDPLHALKGA